MSLFDLTGRVAVITGSSRGIGRAIALACAKMGASIVVSSRKIEACEAVVAEIEAAGGKATAFACNVGVKADLEALVAHAIAKYGRIDILIPNAAINPAYGPSSKVSDEIWNKVSTSNLTATHWLCQMVLPGMAERGGGSVILLSSIVSVFGAANLGIYAISKAAEAQLARNLAVEWGPRGIRVNSIGPWRREDRFRQSAVREPESRGRHREHDLPETSWRTRRHRGRGGVSRFGCRALHHRPAHTRGWRYLHLLTDRVIRMCASLEVPPLTLSLSLWERGRCCECCHFFWRPFSHGEKDRMRGVTIRG